MASHLCVNDVAMCDGAAKPPSESTLDLSVCTCPPCLWKVTSLAYQQIGACMRQLQQVVTKVDVIIPKGKRT